jgi:hypothetical protein
VCFLLPIFLFLLSFSFTIIVSEDSYDAIVFAILIGSVFGLFALIVVLCVCCCCAGQRKRNIEAKKGKGTAHVVVEAQPLMGALMYYQNETGTGMGPGMAQPVAPIQMQPNNMQTNNMQNMQTNMSSMMQPNNMPSMMPPNYMQNMPMQTPH